MRELGLLFPTLDDLNHTFFSRLNLDLPSLVNFLLTRVKCDHCWQTPDENRMKASDAVRCKIKPGESKWISRTCVESSNKQKNWATKKKRSKKAALTDWLMKIMWNDNEKCKDEPTFGPSNKRMSRKSDYTSRKSCSKGELDDKRVVTRRWNIIAASLPLLSRFHCYPQPKTIPFTTTMFINKVHPILGAIGRMKNIVNWKREEFHRPVLGADDD